MERPFHFWDNRVLSSTFSKFWKGKKMFGDRSVRYYQMQLTEAFRQLRKAIRRGNPIIIKNARFNLEVRYLQLNTIKGMRK